MVLTESGYVWGEEMPKDPEKCVHFTVRRVINEWRCLDCNAEFVPKNPKHKTSWTVDRQ